MQLDIYFFAIPDDAAMASMDKWLSSIAKSQTLTDNGIRIWLTHVPETATRPFLNAKPFDILTQPLKLNSTLREEFQVSIGAIPKKHMVCRTDGNLNDDASFDVLMTIALELMKRANQVYLSIGNELGEKMFGPGILGDPFELSHLEALPGVSYEVAHEDDEGTLNIEYFVDSSLLRAWQQSHNDHTPSGETFSRFASLDYS